MTDAEDYDPDEDLSDDELEAICERAEPVAIVTPYGGRSAQIVSGANMLVFSGPTFSAEATNERSPELVQG